ncbi:MAG: cytochrome-c peroxidase [Proteobacteria bacterium]|nr:cytochrome-c peroxidase [Pseudomonadota bacterium]MBU1231965.1 cytochrome-c peroxidase [Pseudomonadota bacterium]MBU1418827.1 cytochrome-c peroxidase [Pseudomonadota bacterium]MBU1453535.1 cytochrome-c peroxidase [Pseudomonadota bacterium]
MNKTVFLTALCSVTLVSSAALAAPALTDMQNLGRHLYVDKDLSLKSTQSCATCHHYNYGFADPTNSRDPYFTVVSLGDDGVSKGGRNAPTSAYAGYSPILSLDADGAWQGGMFWDGRKTGETLGDPLAEQAQGPPLNPVEMNMGSIADVVDRVEAAPYAPLFLKVFGKNAFDNDELAWNNIARAIADYERSHEITAFTSRYDKGGLTAQEGRGLDLVKANCSKCHATEADFGAPAALFTTYRYENIGVPVNDLVLNDEASAYTYPDNGLGGFLNNPDENGKFKIPTLRNVALTAPYSHNGYFPTLTSIVSFHNSREGWPEPEVAENLNIVDVGNMGLSDQDIEDIVVFLHALTD